jgi:hypothetical protein
MAAADQAGTTNSCQSVAMVLGDNGYAWTRSLPVLDKANRLSHTTLPSPHTSAASQAT